MCTLVGQVEPPALHEDAVHLRGAADLQRLRLLRVVRVDEAQGPAVDGVRRNDDAEGLLILQLGEELHHGILQLLSVDEHRQTIHAHAVDRVQRRGRQGELHQAPEALLLDPLVDVVLHHLTGVTETILVVDVLHLRIRTKGQQHFHHPAVVAARCQHQCRVPFQVRRVHVRLQFQQERHGVQTFRQSPQVHRQPSPGVRRGEALGSSCDGNLLGGAAGRLAHRPGGCSFLGGSRVRLGRGRLHLLHHLDDLRWSGDRLGLAALPLLLLVLAHGPVQLRLQRRLLRGLALRLSGFVLLPLLPRLPLLHGLEISPTQQNGLRHEIFVLMRGVPLGRDVGLLILRRHQRHRIRQHRQQRGHRLVAARGHRDGQERTALVISHSRIGAIGQQHLKSFGTAPPGRFLRWRNTLGVDGVQLNLASI
mmetsp:Transcript_48756/g.77689  ORF Transcript_48756/g.77689 Transcript_48756/m.77689 type:complete len:421 (-) Transcript_48756:1480-2742(-)